MRQQPSGAKTHTDLHNLPIVVRSALGAHEEAPPWTLLSPFTLVPDAACQQVMELALMEMEEVVGGHRAAAQVCKDALTHRTADCTASRVAWAD